MSNSEMKQEDRRRRKPADARRGDAQGDRRRQPSQNQSGRRRPAQQTGQGTKARRPSNRAVGVAPTPRGPNRHVQRTQPRREYDYEYEDETLYDDDEQYEMERPRRGGVRIPLVPGLLVLVLCMGLTAFATRLVVLRTHGLTQSSVAKTQAATQQGNEGTSTQASSVATDTQGSMSDSNTGFDTSDGGSNSNMTSSSESSSSMSTSATFKAQPGNGVKSPWLKSGKFSSGDATLDEEVKTFCDGIATTDMDLATAALEVYKGVAWSEYVERDDAQHPAGPDWRIEYARKYYEHDRSGNCYEFASFLSFCLQYLGYTDAHAEGVLIEKQSGDWGDHGLVYVTNLDGTPSLCDTSRGTDGWMLKDTSYNVQFQDFENA